MGAFLGIADSLTNPYKGVSYDEQAILLEQNIYPSQPMITQEAWRAIQSFMLSQAPDSLPKIVHGSALDTSRTFQFKPVLLRDGNPMVTMLKHDPTDSKVYLGFQNGQLLTWDLPTDEMQSILFTSPVIDLDRLNGEKMFSLIGYMHPSEMDYGALLQPSKSSQYHVLLQDLPRPVQTAIGDLSGDGLEDIVVSTFGNLTGHYSWFEQQADGQFIEHQLMSRPGAISSTITDLNEDGLPDIITLMSQGDECVMAFYNTGNGTFNAQKLLSFPAVYGSNSMQVIDFDADGDLDLVITHGDNADLSQVLKPYHGISIYLNNGQQVFQKAYTYPMYGASGTEVADFDLDGDLDIFGLAYFADFSNDQGQLLVYLENRGQFDFKISQIAGSTQGHWLVSDLADIDQDGDPDILLGSNLFKSSEESEAIRSLWDTHLHDLVILENQTIIP